MPRGPVGAAGVAALAALVIAACAKATPAPDSVCRSQDVGRATCPDPTHVLACRLFTWHLEPCRGPGGCTSDGNGAARCDRAVAETGDACGEDGARACSKDEKVLLRCDGAHMVPARMCRGIRGCYRDAPGAPSCDQGPTEEGDPCESEGSHCGADGKSILRCGAAHRYALERSCTGPRGCYKSPSVGAGYLVCDTSAGDVGESCRGVADGAGAWCSRDGRQVNTCKNGLLVRERACPERCVVNWAADGTSYSAGCESL